MATPAVGAACLPLARAAGPGPGPRRGGGGGGDQARPRQPQRTVRRRCVAELSREGPAPRPMPPAQLAPPLVPGFLAPPPASEPASTPLPVPDDDVGGLGLEPQEIAEGIVNDTVVVASEQDCEITVFVDHPSYHRPGNLYGDKFGAYGDNQFRYTLLCYAACEAPLILELGGYIYGQNCMFVVNDWHASLVPVLLAAKYRPYGVYKDSRSILVIHNLAHQGYSWEVTTAEGGQGLDELLSSRKSVLNADDLSGKTKCKAGLQKELGLPIRPDIPLIGFIGRLDYQKGIDLIQLIMPDLIQEDIQFVMLGSGDPELENWMKSTESNCRDKFRGWVGFSVPVSHRITAACDILLMPSRFEPCGLNQLYAMRYGTVPVVHATGGLRDTVENFNPFGDNGEQGTGWAFAPLTTENMLWTLRTAISTYREHKSSWEGLMKRGMSKDFTWDRAAEQYEEIFQWAFIDQPYG
ncbi:Soluble starch synthase 1, chloroplastic/amyloplastic [Dichanthelium oligosanthes]|uniref:Soluble starch synthase 1, chloroplastic/amyloplastic n=1 Tax=Dichanthelium oligosanthes TaxID=888268 RepID=A0A1E5W7I7_9POAL|nr:Soluble starch synthase 1, chloroplastic/amyloplastic [Dichanthelium oligosanthes]